MTDIVPKTLVSNRLRGYLLGGAALLGTREMKNVKREAVNELIHCLRN
jgi:carbon monoxide dehydrogenase subunit G